MSLLLSRLSEIEAALALSLLQAVWWGALVGLAAAVVLAAMARRSAAARHAVGLAFMGAMVALPAWHFAVLMAGDASDVSSAAALGQAVGGEFLGAAPWPAVVRTPAPYAWVAGLWTAGVLAMLVRLCGGLWIVHAFARVPFAPLPPLWAHRADAIRRAFGIARPVAIRVLDGFVQPFAARLLRPVIWLPAVLLTKLEPAQLEALIAHELAHVRRLDWLWNGLQCAIESLLFFHPAAWLLGRRIRLERELACDDLAATHCGDALSVAEALAVLATCTVQRPPPHPALGREPSLRPNLMPNLMLKAGGSALRQRVARLVGAPVPAGPSGSVVLAVLALLLAAGLLASRASVAALPPLAASAALPDAGTAPAADPWWTTVSDSIQVRVREAGHLRDYHAWHDLLGTPHETWRIDGALRPVDDEVRRWVAARRAVVRSMPVPPALPELPRLSESAAFKALAEQLGTDVGAVRELGSPIAVQESCGPCRIDADRVELTLTARGPKGDARVHAEGRLVAGAWHFDRFDLGAAGVLRDLDVFTH